MKNKNNYFVCASSFLSLLAVFLMFIASPAFAEIHVTQDVSGIYYHVEGDKSRSFYPANDMCYLYEGSVDFKDPFLKDSELYGSINYRATDDRRIDTQSFSIERMYMGLKGQAKEFLMGDFYSNFSEYSLGNALKGTKLSFGDDKSSRLILVGGIDTSKWEDLWETRQEDSATRRYVWGSRLENNLFNNKLALNLNYGGAQDDDAYVAASSNPMLINVFSIDGKLNINEHLTASSEIAQSFTDANTKVKDEKTKGDQAMKFGLDLNLKEYTLSSLYSRIGNNFNTTGGFSAQDLETMNFDGMWFLPKKIKFSHYLHMNRDNFSKTKSTTTNQLNPGGKFSFTLPKDISMSLGSDFRKRFSTDKSVNEKTYTYTSNIGKDFNIFYSTLGYTRTVVANKISPSQERTSDTFSLGLDGSFKLKNVKYSWNIGEDIDRTANKEAQKSDFTTATSLGMKINFPSTLAFNLRATIADNNYYINDTDSNTTQYYFSLSRNILRKLLNDNLIFDFTYERRGYRYPDGDTNYAETLMKGKFSYKF